MPRAQVGPMRYHMHDLVYNDTFHDVSGQQVDEGDIVQ
jgi:hypothetical protein